MRKMWVVAAIFTAVLLGHEAEAQQDNKLTLDAALKAMQSADPKDRALGLVGLALIGPDAKGSSREIIGMLNDSDAEVRTQAAAALKAANPKIAAPVIELAQGTDASKRVEAAQQVAKLGGDASAAVPALLKFMDQVKGADRAKVVTALGAVGGDDKKLGATLASVAAKDADPVVRQAAIAALPKMADGKSQVGAIVTAARTDKDEKTRIAAINALGSLGQGDRDAMKTLEGLSKDSSKAVAEAAKKSLEQVRKGK